MLTMPTGGEPFVCMVGIDPGTETLGVAVLQLSLPSLKIEASLAHTFTGSKLDSHSNWISSVHGDRAARIAALEQSLLQVFLRFRPHVVASESPFVSKRFPHSGMSLVEVVSAIRRAVMSYDMWTPLDLIDPPSVKNAVGVKGNKGGKEGKLLMQKAVLALNPVLNYQGVIPMDQLDEHSIDALAVVYARYKTLLEQLCL